MNMKFLRLTLIGALTSKPYAFAARSWELKSIETIDLFDSLGSNIRVDIRGSDIMRILPINNQYINEEWISDKARYAYDGLKKWRFINPMVKKDNIFIQVSWYEIFSTLSTKIKENKFNNFVINTGNFTDLETITALESFSNNFNNLIINNQGNFNSDKQNYFMNPKDLLENIGKKVYIFVGLNLRLQNPVLNIRLRKLSQLENVLIGYIGSKNDYNINLIYLGNNISIFNKILSGKNNFVTLMVSFLKKTNNTNHYNNLYDNFVSILFGIEFLNKIHHQKIIQTLNNFRLKHINIESTLLYNNIGNLNFLELGFFNNKVFVNKDNETNLFYLVGAEETTFLRKKDLIIFQGHHNDKIRLNFDIILPTTNWTEKPSLYINGLGFVQKTNSGITAPINSRTDWKIVRMLSILFNKDINFNNIQEVHKKLNTLTPNITKLLLKCNEKGKFNLKYKNINNYIAFFNKQQTSFKSYIPDYYSSTSVERSSKVMAECSNSAKITINNFYK